MPLPLYLDTARLGKMSPGAQHALSEFHSLAGDIGCCMYFEEFLREGFSGPRSDTPSLNLWRGIGGLKARLKRFAGAAPDSRILLANRSSQLMKLIAHLLAERCRNVLITDLTWPPYARNLRAVADRAECRVNCLPLRARIFSDRLTAADIVAWVHNAYERLGCDGLFLPLVDNLGIHFPVTDCVQALRKTSPVEFVAVDGAQALGHVPLQLADMPCDITLAGCHKWLRAYQPLGLAFFGPPSASQIVETTVHRLSEDGVIDDPLLAFIERLRTGNRSAFSETVNLSPLFTCHGALLDAEAAHRPNGAVRRHNDVVLQEATDRAPWQIVSTDETLRSQIVMLNRSRATPSHPDQVRRRFHEIRVALTAYSNGSIRISLPFSRLESHERELLMAAFRRA